MKNQKGENKKRLHLPGKNIMLSLLQYYDNISGLHAWRLKKKKRMKEGTSSHAVSNST